MRLVLIGCTHGKEGMLEVPDGDILIHTGDFDLRSHDDVRDVDNWFSTLPHKHKLWIAGNHDFYPEKQDIKTLVNFSTYLQDEAIVIEGIKFYGFPWTPPFNEWAFMLKNVKMLTAVGDIPSDVDILISHGPCFGILDQTRRANGDIGQSVGNIPLLDAVKKRIQPKVFVCSHIHEAYGRYFDGVTQFFNVSFMDEEYRPTNKPMVLDVFKTDEGIEVIQY